MRRTLLLSRLRLVLAVNRGGRFPSPALARPRAALLHKSQPSRLHPNKSRAYHLQIRTISKISSPLSHQLIQDCQQTRLLPPRNNTMHIRAFTPEITLLLNPPKTTMYHLPLIYSLRFHLLDTTGKHHLHPFRTIAANPHILILCLSLRKMGTQHSIILPLNRNYTSMDPDSKRHHSHY
jgi:hypothetical protein